MNPLFWLTWLMVNTGAIALVLAVGGFIIVVSFAGLHIAWDLARQDLRRLRRKPR